MPACLQCDYVVVTINKYGNHMNTHSLTCKTVLTLAISFYIAIISFNNNTVAQAATSFHYSCNQKLTFQQIDETRNIYYDNGVWRLQLALEDTVQISGNTAVVHDEKNDPLVNIDLSNCPTTGAPYRYEPHLGLLGDEMLLAAKINRINVCDVFGKILPGCDSK